MIDLTLEWAYYYTVMLMVGVMLLVTLILLIIAEITRLIAKVGIKTVEDRIWCSEYRDQKITELSTRASLASSKKERYKVFDEMKEYRATYIVNRKPL